MVLVALSLSSFAPVVATITGVHDDTGQFMALESVTDRQHDLGRGQHTGLDGVDRDIAGDRFDLLANELGFNIADGGNGAGVLGRQRGDRDGRVAAEGRDGLEVGLDTGPGTRSRSRRWSGRRAEFWSWRAVQLTNSLVYAPSATSGSSIRPLEFNQSARTAHFCSAWCPKRDAGAGSARGGGAVRRLRVRVVHQRPLSRPGRAGL